MKERYLAANNTVVPMGEQIGEKIDVMETFSGLAYMSQLPKQDKMTPKPIIIPLQSSEEQPTKIRVEVGADKVVRMWPDAGVHSSSTDTAESRVISPKVAKHDYVSCNICKAVVKVDFLDSHLSVHLQTYTPRASHNIHTPIRHSEMSRSTALAKVDRTPVQTSTFTPLKQPEKPVLSPKEHFKFREVDTACASASMTQDSRYSDFTLVVFMKEKTTVSSTVRYAGGSPYTTKESERLSIHVVYDSVEDYFTTTTKLMKRGAYSTFDEENVVPDKLIDQKDIAMEIGKALLFFCISPRSVYKAFRRVIRKGEFTLTRENGKALLMQTGNSGELAERLVRGDYKYDKDDWEGVCG